MSKRKKTTGHIINTFSETLRNQKLFVGIFISYKKKAT